MGSGYFPGLVPGANTSGSTAILPYAPQQGGQASIGGSLNPFLPTSIGTGTSMSSYPQSAVSTNATSGIPAYSGGYSPTSVGNTGVVAPPSNPGAGNTGVTGIGAGLGFPTNNQGQNKLYQGLSKTYGAGIASALMNFLSGGAGYNQSAVNNLIAAMQPGFEQNQQNLLSSFSAGGNRFSSGAQLGLSNLMGQQQLDVGQLESQMYEQSVQNYINTLMGVSGTTAQRISGSPGSGDLLSSILSGVGGIVGGLFG